MVFNNINDMINDYTYIDITIYTIINKRDEALYISWFGVSES